MKSLDDATSMTGSLSNPGRVVAGATGLASAAGAGLANEINQSNRNGEQPERLEGAVEGIANTLAPFSGNAIDEFTDQMKEQNLEEPGES